MKIIHTTEWSLQCQLPTSRSVVKVELDRTIVSGWIERKLKDIPDRKKYTHTHTGYSMSFFGGKGKKVLMQQSHGLW